jgi:succinoglycan biosynthesis protein ExoO
MDVSTAPSTTVIMPAHNEDGTIREAVESVLAQTVGDLELIIVDDGSNRPVADLLHDVRDSRLRIFRHPHRRGVSAARNRALAEAQAPFISHLDADDLWEPEYVASVLPCLDDPAVGLGYTDAYVLEGPEEREAWITKRSRHPVDTFPELAIRNPIVTSTVTARAAAIRAQVGYADWLYGGSDYYLWLSLARAGWRFAYVDRRLASYRWPSAGRSLAYPNRKRARSDLRLWTSFALRHPLTPGVARRFAWHLIRTAAYHGPVVDRLVLAKRRTRPGADPVR